MNRTDIVAFVVSAGILDEYKSKDECLSNLVSIASKSPECWQSREDISIGKQLVPAPQIERTYRIRLGHVPKEEQLIGEEQMRVRQLKIAAQQLIDYCASNPDASITAVLFNCSQYSYDVFCGIVNQRLDAICVIVGKPVPAYAMKR